MQERRILLSAGGTGVDSSLAVDLDLPSGNLWSPGNIIKKSQGAYTIGDETDYGCYFSFGNIVGHNEGEGYSFDQTTYNSTPGASLTSNILGTDDEHDAACALFGSPWRLPTKEAFYDLYQNTDRQWVADYNNTGVAGYKLMKKTDHSIYIFLPASGYYDGTTLQYNNVYGWYWSSSWYNTTYSWAAQTYNSGMSPQTTTQRYRGLTIRPFIQKYPAFTAPTARNSTYSGSAQQLVNYGSCTGGTIYYSSDNTNWSTSIPTAVNAGTYTTYWKIVATDSSFVDKPSSSITSTISKTWASFERYAVERRLTYTGSNQNLVVAATVTSGTPVYSLSSSGPWSTSIPQASAVGTYYVYCKAQGDGTNSQDNPYIDTIRVNIVSSYNYNGHDYVDFGLPSGTLWATTNVGASTSSDYGNMYKYGAGTTTYVYGGSPYSGTEEPLSLSYDTARLVWGGNWEEPSKGQIQELMEYCSISSATVNGVKGRTYSRNGKSIFLPYAGYNNNTNAGNSGYYWSCSPQYGEPSKAYYLYSSAPGVYLYVDPRSTGRTVRPVVG